MKKEIIWASISGLLFFVLGITISNLYGQVKKGGGKTVKHSKKFLSKPIKNYHQLSVNHRIAAGYCNNTSTFDKEGYFEFTLENAAQLTSTMRTIRQSLSIGSQPDTFRLIYGKPDTIPNNKNSVMMVVGLVKGVEKLNEAGKSLVYQLEYTLPCPTHCNIANSKVVTGVATQNQSACQ